MGEMEQSVVVTSRRASPGTGHEPKSEAAEPAYLAADHLFSDRFVSDQPHGDGSLAILSTLTDKQRAVLDLLIDHKTSKEISRLLGISPHTVDQRIMLARAKLGVTSRSEVAQAYRRLVPIQPPFRPYTNDPYTTFPTWHRCTMPSKVRAGRHDGLATAAALPPGSVCQGNTFWRVCTDRALPSRPPGDVRRAIWNVLALGTIAAFAMFLILIVLGGLAMYAQLSQIIDH